MSARASSGGEFVVSDRWAALEGKSQTRACQRVLADLSCRCCEIYPRITNQPSEVLGQGGASRRSRSTSKGLRSISVMVAV
jgi:hypothetical protein